MDLQFDMEIEQENDDKEQDSSKNGRNEKKVTPKTEAQENKKYQEFVTMIVEESSLEQDEDSEDETEMELEPEAEQIHKVTKIEPTTDTRTEQKILENPSISTLTRCIRSHTSPPSSKKNGQSPPQTDESYPTQSPEQQQNSPEQTYSTDSQLETENRSLISASYNPSQPEKQDPRKRASSFSTTPPGGSSRRSRTSSTKNYNNIKVRYLRSLNINAEQRQRDHEENFGCSQSMPISVPSMFQDPSERLPFDTGSSNSPVTGFVPPHEMVHADTFSVW
eukprot:CAMPEP_0174274924 /NCGR_PEP_ID=MMETSP0439-20130205/59543_1 /TAXON_ID=0 /ORGANISM="Stereomyxa ramosa, Strain Chinc5" /LENGTH=277 /DNA_ID=CAMNT_0015366977 /DNA_START=26 /DNA_END=856 /DNA_ORIENTATION=+